jgi:uncharacterized protein (DUF2342 family)
MRNVIADIAQMQQRFAESMAQLQLHKVIDDIKTGHQGIEGELSDVLGQMQGQDPMRHRVESLQQGLRELNEHLQTMADQLVDKPWEPNSLVPMKARLDQQASRNAIHG